MAWGVPIHGAWCNTRTWPTVCRYCNRSVFFFKCDCGSAVFFDSLGTPWPKHPCSGVAARHSRAFAPPARRPPAPSALVEPARPAAAEALFQARSPDPTPQLPRITWEQLFPGDDNSAVDRELVERIKANAKRRDHPILRIDAAVGRKLDLEGIVREVHQSADPLKDLRVPNTEVARAFNRRLGQPGLSKLTVHVGSLSDEQLQSYTFFIPRREATGLNRGHLVRFTLEAESVPAHGTRWYCVNVSFLDE